MQITPPFGYQEVVPFLKTQRVRLLKAGEVPGFVQRGNAIPISHTEFQLVGRDYPIVFTSGDGGKTFAAVAVLGISAGENLFHSDRGWERSIYVPAYARRYPFCMAKVTLDKVEQKNRLICVEKTAMDNDGEAMFDAAGKPSERWTSVAEKNLENLNAAQLKNLMRKGVLARIYMHLLSLENFARLLERKAAVAKQPTKG
jgi:hypothetical protein